MSEAAPGTRTGRRPDGVGLTLTEQAPAAAVTVNLDAPPSEVWAEIADARSFREALVNAALEAGQDRTLAEHLDRFDAEKIDALHGRYATLLARTADGDRRAMWDLLEQTRRLGTGRSPFEDVLAAARVFTLADRAPTVAVHVDQAFRDRRAEQRRDACRVLAELARGCDVRLVATGFMQRWLLAEHRTDLPVSREDVTPPGTGPLQERVKQARVALDPDGREVDVLRSLADEPGETLPYTALYADAPGVSNSRIRQVLGKLQDLELVTAFDGPDGYHAELLPAGRELVETLEAEIGRQRDLHETVSETGNASGHAVLPRTSTGGGEGEASRSTGTVGVEYLARREHASAAGTAVETDITLVDTPIDRLEDGRTPRWSYDAGREELVVSAEYYNPLQYWVCVALALVDGPTWRQVLDEDRLEELLEDVPLAILRDARCLGYLKDRDATGEGYIEALQDAGKHLRNLTRKLGREEYDDRDRFRSAVTRDALGLASTAIHLLDLAGVEVIREVRLPEFTRNYDADRRRDVARTVAKGTAIQSKYGEGFTAYRQLYEDREDKREAAIRPTVDASDPLGEVLGRWVLVGSGVDALEGELQAAVRSPAELHEDAPEFAVPVSVGTPGRAAYAETTRRMCETKHLEATRDAVSVLEAFTGSPYDAARALHALSPEDYRKIRLDEVRYALATLPPQRILEDAPPTVSAIVHVLLTAEEPLTQADLADRADVSTRSVRSHNDRLEAFDLVREGEGYRLVLPFRTPEERHERILPWYATPNRDRDDYRDATVKGVLDEAAHELGADGTDAVRETLARAETLQLPPPVRRDVLETWPWAGPLLDAARAFAADELEYRRPTARTVRFGVDLEQASLADVPTGPRTSRSGPDPLSPIGPARTEAKPIDGG